MRNHYLTDLPRKTVWILASFALVLVIGVVDYLTGYELVFSLFYLLPIYLSAWNLGQNYGFAVSFLSAVTWLTADLLAGNRYSHPIIFFWNTAIRLCTFAIITVLLARNRSLLEAERELARTDYMTGAMNSRQFYDFLQMEIDRSSRSLRPFSLAYIDLDNFKRVNDECGHLTGNTVLKTIVSGIKKELRRSDLVARLGGDEFCVLFAETDEAQAHVIIARVQDRLNREMVGNGWPVTFSIGVITCQAPRQTPDALIKEADNLMYRVKASGKDGVQFAIVE